VLKTTKDNHGKKREAGEESKKRNRGGNVDDVLKKTPPSGKAKKAGKMSGELGKKEKK